MSRIVAQTINLPRVPSIATSRVVILKPDYGIPDVLPTFGWIAKVRITGFRAGSPLGELGAAILHRGQRGPACGVREAFISDPTKVAH